MSFFFNEERINLRKTKKEDELTKTILEVLMQLMFTTLTRRNSETEKDCDLLCESGKLESYVTSESRKMYTELNIHLRKEEPDKKLIKIILFYNLKSLRKGRR